MLKTFTTKILIAVLALLILIAGGFLYHRHQAAQAAVFREHQEYEQLRQQVQKDKKKHDSSAAHEGKTWKTYLP